mmetsp:Transcript_48293/g.109492  ORF Transcript_48293/g.109492 Transcript_48293/m.109492 type:complete len:169 (+) Transcript_48293:13-519(+)
MAVVSHRGVTNDGVREIKVSLSSGDVGGRGATQDRAITELHGEIQEARTQLVRAQGRVDGLLTEAELLRREKHEIHLQMGDMLKELEGCERRVSVLESHPSGSSPHLSTSPSVGDLISPGVSGHQLVAESSQDFGNRYPELQQRCETLLERVKQGLVTSRSQEAPMRR